MTYAIAAAGTGGHVFPGLAVGKALVGAGVDRAQILFVGGARLEARTYPEAGFAFLGVELRGLQRSLSLANLTLPLVVVRSAGAIARAYREREVRTVLGMGSYVSVPAGLAAGRTGSRLFLHEQNAVAGLANRLMRSRASAVFGSFPSTRGLPQAIWTGNPIRSDLAHFDRAGLRAEARLRYRLDPEIPVVGIFGGSLGAGVINQAVAKMMAGPETTYQVLHLAGAEHAPGLAETAARKPGWKVFGFEPEMKWFYAAADLVVARAGGAVAELTATSTPAILVPGGFGSSGHQRANAEAMAASGAAVVLEEAGLVSELPATVSSLISDRSALATMAAATHRLAKPDAAVEIARWLVEAHG
jgi:UDP-N-acetylglucosamine--N-acetylmuramyl-(pentapeptide) pyrophosphoryl-undecaprenol N-acetylglucosamine transferase